jgi:hypothetical protein
MNPLRLLSYAVAALMALVGIAVLAGYVAPGAPAKVRWTFGVVLLLFAAYRVAVQGSRGRDHA